MPIIKPCKRCQPSTNPSTVEKLRLPKFTFGTHQSLNSPMSVNKERAYICYYPVSGNRFHVGLMITPKNPKATSEEENCNLYHAINVVDANQKKQVWRYLSRTKKRPRTHQLISLMYLGKLDQGQTTEAIDQVCLGVPIIQDDPNWRCRHWLISALTV